MSKAVPTILIVDAVLADIRILGDILSADHRLIVATDGPQTLELAQECRPDLILMDVAVSGMDGFGLLRRLHLTEQLEQVPVILVTAQEGPTAASQEGKLGVTDYLPKPYSPEVVRLRVKNQLELARQRRLLKKQQEELERRFEFNPGADAQQQGPQAFFRALCDSAPIGIVMANSDGQGEELIKIQKLESLGQLARGIAHDFNNILTGILGNISLAQVFVDASSKAHGALREAEKASERAVELSRQLLSFAQGGEPVKKAVSVQDLLGESVSRALRGSNVQGVIEVPDGIRAVEVDEEQMVQAIGNVVLNAAQAMPEGGRLTVAAEDVQLGAHNALGLAVGAYVKVTVTDEGCGIPEDCLWKIFDPYFSTKPQSTGLGLASTHSIIAKHKGHIGVQSAPGKGSVFTLHLASVRPATAAGAGTLTVPAAERHRGGSVLVMDDEQMIRTIAGKMLEDLGYRVTTCDNGAEATALYQAALDAGTPFDTVIVDLTVAGGMGGKTAAQQILALDPGARLIVSSGYCNDPVLANFRDYGFCCVLAKPYKAADMSAVLSKVLQAQ